MSDSTTVTGTFFDNLIFNGNVLVENTTAVATEIDSTLFSCPAGLFIYPNGRAPVISATSNIQIDGTVTGVGFLSNSGPGTNSEPFDEFSDLYGANHAGLGTVISQGLAYIEEEIVLTANDVINKSFPLLFKPVPPNIAVNIIGGTALNLGTDFTVDINRVNFIDPILASVIAAGDRVRVLYLAVNGLTFPIGEKYGSYEWPTSLGSGSGEAAGGGGVTLLAPSGTVHLNGFISMDGADGTSSGSGGGAGGSILAVGYNLDGTGSLSAAGGNATYVYGGGGGGGYISLQYENNNSFTGSLNVAGHKGSTHGITYIHKLEPILQEKFTGSILNPKWWSVIHLPVDINNMVIMDTSSWDTSDPEIRSLFTLSGTQIKTDVDFIPAGSEPAFYSAYYRLYIDDRNWVGITKKIDSLFGEYSVEGAVSQTAVPFTFMPTKFRILKSDSTFTFQYVDSTGPKTFFTDTIPEFKDSLFTLSMGTAKDATESFYTFLSDNFRLDGADISNGYVTLSAVPDLTSNVTLNVVGGCSQDYGTDFTVSGLQLFWNPVNLALAEGDQIIADYVTDIGQNDLSISWDNVRVWKGILGNLETTAPRVYVDWTHGSDYYDGQQLTPLKNLFVATAWAKKGSTVILYDGTYNPTEIIKKDLTILGANGASPVITTANVQDTTGSNWENSCLTFKDCQGLVKNIILRDASTAITAENTHDLEISNCDFFDSTVGIKFTTCTNSPRILRNTFHDLASTGVIMGLQVYNPEFNSNVFYNNPTDIDFTDTNGYLVSANTLNGTGAVGINVTGGSTGSIISNNITNLTAGIQISADSTVTSQNNNFYGDTSGIINYGVLTEVNDISIDPQYVGAPDFHLTTIFPDGTSAGDNYLIDRDFVHRDSSPYDIGAYRYVSATHIAGDYYVDSSGDDFLNTGNLNSRYRTLDRAMFWTDSSSVLINTGSWFLNKPIFTGTGLNDATVYCVDTSNTYTIIIDSTGFPDTFSWSINSDTSTTGINVTGTDQTLSGLQCKFDSTTGHTLKDQWVMKNIFINTSHFDSYNLNLKNKAMNFADSDSFHLQTFDLESHYSNINLGSLLFVSPNGSDVSGSGTISYPFRTISKALTIADATTTVLIIPAEYQIFDGSNSTLVPWSGPTDTTEENYLVTDKFWGSTQYPGHSHSDSLWVLSSGGDSSAFIQNGYMTLVSDETYIPRASSVFNLYSDLEVSAELRSAFNPVCFSVGNANNNITIKYFRGDCTSVLVMDDATNIYYSHVADMNIPDTTTETLCLSGQDIQEKFVSPFSLIASTSAVTVNRNGNPIILGVDYVVEKNVLQWSGTSLDGTMTAGDVLQVTYMPEDVSPTAKIIVKVDTPDSSHPGEYTPVETLLSVQAITVDTTNIIMARTLNPDTTADPWNIQFYVDNSEDSIDYGRGYISNFVATADSITGTDRVKQNALKTWRKPLLIFNDRRPMSKWGSDSSWGVL